MITTLIGHLLAVCIGLSLGLIGGGGSILAVPILVYVMGVNSQIAISMSLFIVGSVSLFGVIPYAWHSQVSWRIAAGFIPTAMLGAYLGTQLIRLPMITETVQLVSFGLVMLAASVLMIRRGRRSVEPQSAKPQAVAAQPAVSWLILLEGLGVGIVTGFVGVGGGFLIIPALVLLGGVPMKTAVGTSLLIIAFNSATGFLGYLNQVAIDWGLTLSFTLAAGLGTLLGSRLARVVSAEQLQKGFGYFVLAVAIFVLVKR